MPVLRQVVGETLRGLRLRQRRTLREISADARVSLGYLSEVERGQKEASSELLSAICGALEVELSELFAEVSQALQREEKLTPVNRVTLVGTQTARLTPAPADAGAVDAGGARVHALTPKPASVAAPTAAA